MSPPPRFFVFSAGYNCATAAEACLQSIAAQTYQNFVHIVIDDFSTDDTWARILCGKGPRTIAYRNTTNKKWLPNALEYLRPADDDIVALVDLDDWLLVPEALQVIADIYTNEDCWLTYGNYCHASALPKSEWLRKLRAALKLKPRAARHCRPLAPENLAQRTFREIGYCTSHLRTFKGFLWNVLRTSDLTDQNGRYPVAAQDVAIMYPMLEMCRPGKIRFVSDVLYVYNDLNPINEHKISKELQRQTDDWFRRQSKHPVLERED